MKMVRIVDSLCAESLKDCNVIVVIGDSCVGKSFVSKKIQDNLYDEYNFDFDFIEVSDIVKKLSTNNENNGLDLLQNNLLMQELVNSIIRSRNVILCGLREKKIHDYITDNCKKVFTLKVTALDDIVLKRIKQRKVTNEKLHRDRVYDYDEINANFVLYNNDKFCYKKIFWLKDFRLFLGLTI